MSEKVKAQVHANDERKRVLLFSTPPIVFLISGLLRISTCSMPIQLVESVLHFAMIHLANEF